MSAERRQEILATAIQYVTHDRNTEAGEPERNFDTIAGLWNTYLHARKALMYDAETDTHHIYIEPHDVAVMMILLKVSRLAKSPLKDDHWIDIAGYAACGADTVKPNG